MPTPDTTAYLWLAYAATFALLALFVVALVVRWRSLANDADVLASLDAPDPHTTDRA